MPRGSSVPNPCLRGSALRGYSLRSHTSNLARDCCTVPVRAKSTKLVSSLYHSDRGAELRESDARHDSSCNTSLASLLKSHRTSTLPRSSKPRKPLSDRYLTRDNSTTSILALSQKKILSRWCSAGGPASPGSDEDSAEINKFWDGLHLLLKTAIRRSRFELDVAINQTKRITIRLQGYDVKEPDSRLIQGSHVYDSISTARTKLMRYKETITSAHLLIGRDQSTHETLAELEGELLGLDRGLEGCQRRLRAREVEDTKKQGDESEDDLTLAMALGSGHRESDGRGYDGEPADGSDD